MGESGLFHINISPILKHTVVKPSLVPRIYPRTQTNCNVKRDAVCRQVWQPDDICQTASGTSFLASFPGFTYTFLLVHRPKCTKSEV